ncbi:MAG: sigma-70 family RNA polymerase sigma factor [Bacteroidales bacterium]|nr:sigma-70 family RNA polymerase sigma factor [Bacteroidales bacterium]
MKKLTREDFKYLFDQKFDSIRSFIFYKCSDEEMASDIAQDVFTKIWEKGIYLHPDRDKNLLYKMASDAFISKIRRKKTELNFVNSITIENSELTGEENLKYQDLKHQYSKALSDMTRQQREAFLMSRSQGLKYDEIAKSLNISVKAVEKRISNSLALLKRRVG